MPKQLSESFQTLARVRRKGRSSLPVAWRLTDNGRGKGHFVAPTLFANVTSDSFLGQEELFGPVLG